jgi:hypothetical protein
MGNPAGTGAAGSVDALAIYSSMLYSFDHGDQ